MESESEDAEAIEIHEGQITIEDGKPYISNTHTHKTEQDVKSFNTRP
jgi:hypothetical protein